MMDEFVIMNVEDYQKICDTLRDVENSTNTFTIDDVINVVDNLISSETEDRCVRKTVTEISSDKVTTVRAHLFHSSSLTSVDFPNATSIATYGFAYSNGLTELYFPSVTSIGDTAIRECTNLVTLDCPKLLTIGNSTARGCTSLENLNLPSCTKVSNITFYGCSKLAKVDFPKVTSIGSQAFYNCSILETLILRSGTRCSLSATNALTNTPIAKGTGYIYVPSTLIESYKTATNWTTYANQFRTIEDYPEICGG